MVENLTKPDFSHTMSHTLPEMLLVATLELRDQPASDVLAAELRQQADDLLKIGFNRLYIIDRDAQYSDKPFNIGQVRSFLKIYEGMTVGVGGGIKTMETLDQIIEAGATRVILGPMFWRQEHNGESLFAIAARKYPGKLLAIIDAYRGWVHQNPHEIGSEGERIMDVALRLEAAGAMSIVYLERERSGFYGGIDEGNMADLAFALQVPLFVTGGINSLDHLRALKSQAATGIAGAILGRALIDGRIDPVSALTIVRAKD